MSFEGYVDSTISVFFAQLEGRFVEPRRVCDLGAWLQWFAFDVMGEITFSRRLGFLDRGKDIDDIAENIWRYFRKASPITQIPWVDRIWTKNPILQRFKSVRVNPVVEFAVARARERQLVGEDKEGLCKDESLNSNDFLSRFLAAVQKDPSIPAFALTAWTTSNVTAGSDTTAILLRTIFYNLLTHRSSLQTLLAELDDAANRGRLSNPVKWKEARELPYLDAVIKEGGRLHPPFGLPLERVVPQPGATVCGKYLPPGTVVGMSGWVVHRDPNTFGEDCEQWRPERWLECGAEERRRMEHALLTVRERISLETSL